MTAQQFTRAAHNTSYVAYASKPSKPQALVANGEQVTARLHPDVFVNEYMSVKIESVTDNGETVNIRIDPKSVVTTNGKGLKYGFGANTKSGSPIHQLAVQAKESGRAVYLGIETRRRYKVRGSGETIPYTTPIHVLRGCKDGPQSGGNAQTTGDNCSKIIAVLGYADEENMTLVSEESDSNPYRWHVLRDNQEGNIPPQGFIVPTGPNGEPVGGIIQALTVASSGGADPAVAEKIDRLMKMVAHLQKSQTGGAGARPWHETNEDGTANPASYAVAHARKVRAFATRLVATVADSGTEAALLRETESALTRVMLWMTDGVQAQVAGRVDRMSKSHDEAFGWVKHVCEFEDAYTAEMMTNKDLAKAWATRVRKAATERYIEVVELTSEYLAAQNSTSTPVTQAAEAAQEQPATEPIVMMADDAEAIGMWDGLIEQVGMAENVDSFNPLLTKRFGSHFSNEIPADALREALSEWMADPQAFNTEAHQAYMEAQSQQAA